MSQLPDQLMASKTCPSCGISKPFDAFSKRASRPDGREITCRACRSEARSAAYKGSEEQQKANARAQAYYWANREKVLAKIRSYPSQSVDARRAYAHGRRKEISARLKQRRNANPILRINHRVSQALRKQLLGGKSWRRTADLLGYTAEDLKLHLERQFLKGMSWENMGKWHIDHIIPLSSFRITGTEDPGFRRAWSLSNLRPLWAADNIRKHARVETLL